MATRLERIGLPRVIIPARSLQLPNSLGPRDQGRNKMTLTAVSNLPCPQKPSFLPMGRLPTVLVGQSSDGKEFLLDVERFMQSPKVFEEWEDMPRTMFWKKDSGSKEMANGSAGTRFLLSGFSEVQELQLLQAMLFLVIYLTALVGNLLLLTVITLHRDLHTPMYFFLKNLSFLDICYISVTVPRSIFCSLTGDGSISFLGCVTQVCLFVWLADTEVALLTAMALDRYVAICHPLRYEVIITGTACVQMAAISWLGGGLSAVAHTTTTFSVPLCGPRVIHQFFCDIPSLLQLSCSHSNLGELVLVASSCILGLGCFALVVASYVRIFSAVLRAPSQGRAKAFSTFLHLTLTVFYTVLPPALNPVIYSLRNREVKAGLKHVLHAACLRIQHPA
ncbi:olfactory receptor 14A16-like [Tachyglossus aculeatus]|uniref:olfactory receptor 14A16-like n=1 Tax=Tachyglossus aculeatus TaxID=9261 RepID=UPI0018F42F5C|nr:olfactory receptor 14A16-like [Tachyglossus aculeatus]